LPIWVPLPLRARGPGADRTGDRGRDLPQLGRHLEVDLGSQSRTYHVPMNAKETRSQRHADPGSLEELSAAIESGAGMPAVARAAARALNASVALIDRSSNVLAVA